MQGQREAIREGLSPWTSQHGKPASNASWPEQARKESSDQNLEQAAAGKATGPQLTSCVCQGQAGFSACLPVSGQGFPLAKPYWEVEDEASG